MSKETLHIEIPETESQELEMIAPLVGRAQSIEVVDLPTYQAADGFRSNCKKMAKFFEEEVCAIPLAEANRHHKTLCAWRDGLVKPLTDAAATVGQKMLAWKAAEDRRALLEREAAQKEANRKAEEERAARAAAIAAQGRAADAAAVLARPVQAAPVPLRSAAPAKPKGSRDNWVFTIEDANLIPREYLMPDEQKIRAYGKAMKADAKIPGVSFRNEPTL